MGSSGVGLSGATPKVDGALATVGTGGMAPRDDHVHGRTHWAPADQGFLTWQGDPALYTTGSTTTGGTVYLSRLHLPVAATVTNVCLFVTAVGVALTSGQCFAALYSAAGGLLGTTADQSAAWVSTGLKTMALAGGTYSATAADYYVAFFWNGSTSPTWLRGASQSSVNVGLSAPNLRFASADTGRTTSMPSTLGAQSSVSATAWWAALS